MKVLVTGGAGFIGSHIVDRLIENNYEVTVLDNLSVGKAENVHRDAVLVKGDVTDKEVVRKLVKDHDFILHNAAKVSIRNSVNTFYEDAKVNLLGTLNILDAMKNSGVKRLVFASSMGVYSKNGLKVKEEDVSLEQTSPYGIGKLAAERYCLYMCREMGKDCVALRYCNTYGTRQTPTPYVGVITIFVNNLLNRERPVIYGDGEQIRDYVYVKDVAEANLLAMKTRHVNEVYNVGTGIGVSVNKLYSIICENLDADVKPRFLPADKTELRCFTADMSKAERLLNFRAEHKVEDRIREVIDWWICQRRST